MPYWYVSEIITLDGQTYVYSVGYYEPQNYVQTPELTLEKGRATVTTKRSWPTP
jgi:hypothetical protein